MDANFSNVRMLVLLGSVLLCVGVAGCSDEGVAPALRSVVRSTASDAAMPLRTGRTKSAPYRTGDNDVDDEYGRDPKLDGRVTDDYPLTEYGHVATVADEREIASLVQRYYAAAAAVDGRKACSLLYSRLARDPSSTKTVPEDRFSYPVHVHVSAGESCAKVTSRLFRSRHHSLEEEALTLRVTAVRTGGVHGVAVLGFKTVPEHWIPVLRDHGVWKIHTLLAMLLP
jgi:hypothetical protein